MEIHVFRIKPDQDLKIEIDSYVQNKKIKAGCILTCVGNLKKAVIRMADAEAGKPETIREIDGPFEIVFLVGTVELGNSHLHLSISDKNGMMIGGHLKNGSIVGITAEVVIGEFDKFIFSREIDQTTGYKELVVTKSAE